MEIFTTEGKILEDIILSVVSDNLKQKHHLYLDNYYNTVKAAKTL
jgi:hypothetical protein